MEGLIEIAVEPAAKDVLPELADFGNDLPDFPVRREALALQGVFQWQPQGPSTSAQQQIVGYQYVSQDNKRVLQVRADAFVLSFLEPYPGFEILEQEARRLWSLYASRAEVGKATRVTLRYINRLNLPLPFGDFSEYILTAPNIAPGIPQGLSKFLMQVVVPDPNTANIGIITETMEGQTSEDGKQLPLVLDIAVSQTIDLEVASDGIWEIVSSLRKFKNQLFFGSLTENLLRMYR